MNHQTVFKRYEYKYLLTRQQQQAVLQAMEPYMALDRYGRTAIRNLYFDTADYRLIRRSIEKPVYKEKLRIRSYAQAQPDSVVFAEIKKKYKRVVYKRRVLLPQQEAMDWLTGTAHTGLDTQITREIDWFLSYYGGLRPTVFLCYDREAYYAKDGSDFRITFDDRILSRQQELSLCAPAYGVPLLGEEQVLMEIKCSGGIPLWMTAALTALRIYRTSFSKYGTAYLTTILPEKKEALFHVGTSV